MTTGREWKQRQGLYPKACSRFASATSINKPPSRGSRPFGATRSFCAPRHRLSNSYCRDMIKCRPTPLPIDPFHDSNRRLSLSLSPRNGRVCSAGPIVVGERRVPRAHVPPAATSLKISSQTLSEKHKHAALVDFNLSTAQIGAGSALCDSTESPFNLQ